MWVPVDLGRRGVAPTHQGPRRVAGWPLGGRALVSSIVSCVLTVCGSDRGPSHGLRLGSLSREKFARLRGGGATLGDRGLGGLAGLPLGPPRMAEPEWRSLNVRAESLQPLQRVTIRGRSGRAVVLLRASDHSLHCLDYHCFHAGAALGSGELIEIEDIGTALRCPAHGYCVSVHTGEQIVPATSGVAQCGSHVQRRHPVRVDPDGLIFAMIGGPPIKEPQPRFTSTAPPSQPSAPNCAPNSACFPGGGSDLSLPSDKHNVPAAELHRESSSTPSMLSFGRASRKRQAVAAVSAKMQQARSLPAPAASPASALPTAHSAAAVAAPQRPGLESPTSTPTLRQSTLGAMWGVDAQMDVD